MLLCTAAVLMPVFQEECLRKTCQKLFQAGNYIYIKLKSPLSIFCRHLLHCHSRAILIESSKGWRKWSTIDIDGTPDGFSNTSLQAL